MPPESAVPAGFRLRPDRSTFSLPLAGGGVLLVGGAPRRVLRLTSAGAAQVASWWAGAQVPAGRSARLLAGRLLDGGMAHPVVFTGALSDVTVVVPARDRAQMLARCLAGLTASGQPPVIVVDDGSADPAGVAAVAAAAGARLVRRAVNGGPGAARNTGFAASDTPVVAFVDSDCVPRPGWLGPLLAHLIDPAVGAVAPRIVAHEPTTAWLSRYEAASSALDMGKRAGVVSSGMRVPYVPTAALVVRRAAFGAGFDEEITAGEDVDFVWRLTASGWRVRYEPRAEVAHQHRVRLRAWFGRRRHYGTSAVPLEARHPGAVRPLYVSWWTAAAWLAVAAGRPGAGAGVTAASIALLARRLSAVTGERWPVPAREAPRAPLSAGPVPRLAAGPVPARGAGPGPAREASRAPGWTAWRLAARLAGGGTAGAARPIGSAITRAWWPVAVPVAVAVPRLRVPLAALVLIPPVLDWMDQGPPLDPARYVAARLLGDLAYSIGLWQECARRRDLRPLLPVIGTRRVRLAGGASRS
jgi:mycofactocin glycosyltransferase